jgi:uncharacterized protein (DUF2164 family)
MADITFTKEEKSILVDKLKIYFEEELSQEMGQFDCEFLLDFISTEIGSYYYNRGVSDAQSIVLGKMEDLTDAFYQIEQPTDFQNR